MRWIFITLLLLNGAYFGWEFWQQSQHAPGVPVQAGQALPALKGQKLELLTERLPAPASPVPPPTIAPEKPAPSPAPAGRAVAPALAAEPAKPAKEVCSSVGPFPQEAPAAGLVDALSKAGVESVLDSNVVEKEAQYWVVLPPEDSRRKALQTLRELQARKIDSYLISSGELKNAISLGLFTRDELAKGVQEKIKEAGYPAEIRLKERSESEFWVRIRPGQPVEKAKKVLNSYVSGDSGIKISNSPCEMFALTR